MIYDKQKTSASMYATALGLTATNALYFFPFKFNHRFQTISSSLIKAINFAATSLRDSALNWEPNLKLFTA
ncbi:hypothetical protein DN614_23180 [Klebsiella michiganensis]|nr:hypothetical protein CDA56_10345 [Klebsiella michiganensis]RWS81779.1 hypothetical protein DN614_23180 [Klebsiella michiganensis]